MSAKVLTPVVDKNGKQTSRWKGREAPRPSHRLSSPPALNRPSGGTRNSPYYELKGVPLQAAEALVSAFNKSKGEYDGDVELFLDEKFYDNQAEEFGVRDDEDVAVIGGGRFRKAVAIDQEGVARLVARGYDYDEGLEWEAEKPFASDSVEIRRMSLMALGRPCGYVQGEGSFSESGGTGPVGYTTSVGAGNKLYRENGSSTSWVTRQTRKHIKEAVAAGLLPEDIEYRATTYHNTVNITATGEFNDPELGDDRHSSEWSNSNQQGIKETLESLAEQYNWSMRDNIGEVNNNSLYAHATLHQVEVDPA